MDLLLDCVQSTPLPLSERRNVCEEPVKSITLGLVNKRAGGYGISSATTHGKLRLLQLLVGLTADSAIAGEPPPLYTSICLNVDFSCQLHTDAFNSGLSTIVAIGDFTGGDLFIEKEAEEEREARCIIEHEGAPLQGVDVDVRRHWYKFDGGRRHRTQPYSGFRVSVVYFSVPTDRCDIADLARLHSLGFRVPSMPLVWPYHVFVCSTRRSSSVVTDTLRILFEDESVPAHAVTICVKDAQDVAAYRTGLRTLVAEAGGRLAGAAAHVH